ncbi:hypothetical protein [Aeromicrobium sp.]|uniref:hypothetical protein n=1 Tax=Aeromicrobium sp. TaxID=1871063 RepID=UPI003C5C0C12
MTGVTPQPIRWNHPCQNTRLQTRSARGVRHLGQRNLIYFGITALVLNLIVADLGTYVCRALSVDAGVDDTHPTDYLADAGHPEVVDRLDPVSTPPVV